MTCGSDAVVSCRRFVLTIDTASAIIDTASALYRHFTGIRVVGSSPPPDCPSTLRDGMDDSVTCSDGYRVGLTHARQLRSQHQRHLPHGFHEGLLVEWLGEVSGEAGLEAARHILVVDTPAHGDRRQLTLGAELRKPRAYAGQ